MLTDLYDSCCITSSAGNQYIKYLIKKKKKLLSSTVALISSSWISPSSICCLDCTASREKNAAIYCGMRNSSILNRRALLSSRTPRMPSTTFSGSFFLPVQQVTNTCKYYELFLRLQQYCSYHNVHVAVERMFKKYIFAFLTT